MSSKSTAASGKSSAASGKSSAASGKSSASSAASGGSSKSSAASASKSTAGSKSSASSASGSGTSGSSASGSSASGSSASGSSASESDTTEKSISEVGGNTQPSVSAATQYDVSVAQAVSAYAQSARNLQNYSIAGPMNKDQNKSMASAVKQLQGASKAASVGGGGKPTGRKVLVMRHGERMDRLFPEWLQVAITDEGKYRPYDMNQPLTMIERLGGVGWAGYEHDSPVTEMGNLSGQMVGRGLKNCRVDVKQVVSSPALRCVQTANAILKAMENPDLKMCIEPGLFEWLQWYDKMPQWFEPATLAQTGKYRINEMYKPVMSVSEVVTKKNESTKEYADRIANVTKQVLEQFKNPGSTLIVGHGSTMDVMGRSLAGKSVGDMPRGEMDQMGIHYPYCAVVALEEQQGGAWRVMPGILPQLTFLGFSNRFNPDYFNRV